MGIACVVLGGMLWWKHLPAAQLSPAAQLGQLIFHDTSLSASGQQSCATCHVASLGHASARGLEAGGASFEHPGERNVPSLRYLSFNQGLQWDEEGKASGGFFWDGRTDSLQAQAGEPFLNPHEMANTSRAEVVQRLQTSAYAKRFSAVFGNGIWRNPDQAFDAMTAALASYQTQDPVFRRFDSLFDRVMQGQAQFSAQQERGWRLFQDEEKGNCAACHTAQAAADGTPALFTDFSYDNLGVPRHTAILANAQTTHFDLGLCNPQQSVCGAFKVPSLRNVAVRRAFSTTHVLTICMMHCRFMPAATPIPPSGTAKRLRNSMMCLRPTNAGSTPAKRLMVASLASRPSSTRKISMTCKRFCTPSLTRIY
jgi:cytochrome c peroxidase